jgi:hypothetical protein
LQAAARAALKEMMAVVVAVVEVEAIEQVLSQHPRELMVLQ